MIEPATDSLDGTAARHALARGGDVCDAARAALAAIHRDAIERAAPYVATLARFEALRPPSPLVIDPAALAPVPPFDRIEQTRQALRHAFSDAPGIVRDMLDPLLASATPEQLDRLRRSFKT